MDVFEAYKRWPADIRAKLSVHDLRRMDGWSPKPHKIGAKPLEWEEGVYCGGKEWGDKAMGFHIGYDGDEPEDQRYCAAWGEGEPERFATLDEAKAWCQSEVDDWIRKNAILVV